MLAPPRHLAQRGADISLLPPSTLSHSLHRLLPLGCLGLPFPRTRAEACPFLPRLCSCPGLEEPGEELGGFPASSGPSPHHPGTWHPAPGTWRGQREEEAPFPGHPPGLFLSRSPIIFTVTLRWAPLISGGSPILRLRGSLRDPLGRTQNRKECDSS